MIDEVSEEESEKIRRQFLTQRQGLPLDVKVKMSKERIKSFYEKMDGKVFVAFSGGKDSTVLLHLVRSVYPDVPAVFVDTGLEYPELKDFVKQTKNVTTIRPAKSLKQVLDTHGYPVLSKDLARRLRELQNPHDGNKMTRHLFATGERQFGKNGKALGFRLGKKWQKKFNVQYDENIGWYSDFNDFQISEECCNIMKKTPIKKYEQTTGRYPYIGLLAVDSQQRQASYVKTGCNTYTGDKKSRPLSFWKEEDIWSYIRQNKLHYSDIYLKGVNHTGCMFCMFGVHLEKEPNRFQQMKTTHPKLYDYCINTLDLKKILDFIDVKYK